MSFNFPMQAPQPPSNQVGFQPQMPNQSSMPGGYSLGGNIQAGFRPIAPGGQPGLLTQAPGSFGGMSQGQFGNRGMSGSGGSSTMTRGSPGPGNVAPYGYAPNGNPYGNMSHTQVGNPLPNSGGGGNSFGGGLVGGAWQFQNPYYSYNPNSGMGGPNVNPNQFAAQGGGSGYTANNQSPFGRYSSYPLGMQQRF